MPLVLGMDPGFASFGWAIMDLPRSWEVVCGVGVIRTAPAKKRLRVRATDDNLTRAGFIARHLREICHQDSPALICTEAFSQPRSATVAAKVAMSYGVIAGLAQSLGIPLLQVTPQEIKQSVCGRVAASKADVRDAIRARYPGHTALDEFEAAYPEGQYEHGYDAVAAIVACLDSDMARLVRGMCG